MVRTFHLSVSRTSAGDGCVFFLSHELPTQSTPKQNKTLRMGRPFWFLLALLWKRHGGELPLSLHDLLSCFSCLFRRLVDSTMESSHPLPVRVQIRSRVCVPRRHQAIDERKNKKNEKNKKKDQNIENMFFLFLFFFLIKKRKRLNLFNILN